MKKTFKKALALTLALVMVFGSAPLAGLDLFGVNARAEEYQVGDHIYFGSYPQSEVKDSATLTALNGKSLNWISYGYYSGDGSYGSMVQGDWMKYADTTYNGNKYRAVKFTQYRPRWTEYTSSAGNSYQDDNGYELNTVYWFKYEPIEWRVLDPAKGLVMAETCIDSQAFSNTIYKYGTDPNGNNAYCNDEAHTHYASDYATSSIRKWLNDDFYNTAFNEPQKSQIATTTLDYSSPYSSTYDSVTTNDKVFLLSYYDLINPSYGFSSDDDEYDVARRAKSTDYAKAQGCWQNTSSNYAGNADWWLRSPGSYSYYASYVYSYGYVYYFNYVSYSGIGVRPALILNLKSGIFESEIESDDTINFGSYPQSRVTDNSLLSALNKQSLNWMSYGYYSGNNYGNMVPGDWMMYADVEYGNSKYRAVKFTQSRTSKIVRFGLNYFRQKENGYKDDTVYWFEYEPIEWQVLDPEEGLVIAKTCIDAQAYSNTIYFNAGKFYNDASYSTYANDYKTSSIRKWLNDDFYNTAFNESEKAQIIARTLDNSSPYDSAYDSASTTDKVWLLSYDEAMNSSYRFLSDTSNKNISQCSDYAKCQGCWSETSEDHEGNTYLWLRSPGDSSKSACHIYYDGHAYGNCEAFTTDNGIRPAIKLNRSFEAYDYDISETYSYNIGQESYSFANYEDEHSEGHCFGMSVTSSAYHLRLLKIEDYGGNTKSGAYNLEYNETTKEPICDYQAIQGSYIEASIVAGGKHYLSWFYDINSDWQSVIKYVKNHEFDNTGSLVTCIWAKKFGGHAVNFLRYAEVDGQPRIYVYDNNFPNMETYIYKGSDGKIYQGGGSSFNNNPIDSIALVDVKNYFDNLYLNPIEIRFKMIFAKANTISVENSTSYPMLMDSESGEWVVYEVADDVTEVKIIPLEDNAEFVYLGETYKFGNVDYNTVGTLKLAEGEEPIDTEDSFKIEKNLNIKIPESKAKIKTPSTSTINYGDGIILHFDVDDELPTGAKIVWSSDNNNFKYTVSADGKTCTITPQKSGDTTFTAKVVDENGKVISEEYTQKMTSKAGFFQKLISFFKKLFKINRIIAQSIDSKKA